MFPALIEGSVPIVGSDVETLARRLLEDLRTQGVIGSFEGNTISFLNDRNATFQRWHFTRYQIVDRGEFTIGDGELRYRLYTALALVGYSTLMLLPLAFCLATQRLIGAVIVMAVWALIVGGSFFLAAFRNRRALERIVAT